MKKITLFALIMMFLPIVKAQDDFRKFKFGVKGSPNISWFTPDQSEFENDGVKFRFSYGLVTEFAFGNNYSLFTGVELLSTGGSLDFGSKAKYSVGNEQFVLTTRSYNLNYVNIPLNLKMTTNEIGFMRYFALFGVDFGTRTRARAIDDVRTFTTAGNSTTLSPTTTKREDVDVLKDVQLFRLALNLGLGATYNISGNTDLLVSLNWSNGFTNALKKESNDLKTFDENNITVEGEKFKQKVNANFVTLNLGIMF